MIIPIPIMLPMMLPSGKRPEEWEINIDGKRYRLIEIEDEPEAVDVPRVLTGKQVDDIRAWLRDRPGLPKE